MSGADGNIQRREPQADTDDRVVALGRVRLRGKGSGVGVDQPHGWLVEFKDGKVFRFRHFARPQEALEAAGLRE